MLHKNAQISELARNKLHVKTLFLSWILTSMTVNVFYSDQLLDQLLDQQI